MKESDKAAKRSEFSERLKDPSFQRVLAASAAWFLVWAVMCAFLRYPGEMLLAALTMTWILRNFLIALMHWLYRFPALRGVLDAMTADPAERGYTVDGEPWSLRATFCCQALILWPLMALGIWGMQRQSGWTLAIWGLFVLKDLLWKGIYMKYDEPLNVNYEYNSLWLVGGLIFLTATGFGPAIILGMEIARLFGVRTPGFGWWLDQFWVQYAMAIAILGVLHMKDLLERIARWKIARGRARRGTAGR